MQLCHTLCVTTQLPLADGGGAGKVAFVDTEGTFRPERVRAIAARFNLDPDAVLDNVRWVLHRLTNCWLDGKLCAM